MPIHIQEPQPTILFKSLSHCMIYVYVIWKKNWIQSLSLTGFRCPAELPSLQLGRRGRASGELQWPCVAMGVAWMGLKRRRGATVLVKSSMVAGGQWRERRGQKKTIFKGMIILWHVTYCNISLIPLHLPTPLTQQYSHDYPHFTQGVRRIRHSKCYILVLIPPGKQLLEFQNAEENPYFFSKSCPCSITSMANFHTYIWTSSNVSIWGC